LVAVLGNRDDISRFGASHGQGQNALFDGVDERMHRRLIADRVDQRKIYFVVCSDFSPLPSFFLVLTC
jgi:hypothetical protein